MGYVRMKGGIFFWVSWYVQYLVIAQVVILASLKFAQINSSFGFLIKTVYLFSFLGMYF